MLCKQKEVESEINVSVGGNVESVANGKWNVR